MANTPNFALYKPDRADTTVDVDTSLANNFTIIDTELKTNKDGLATHISNPNAHTSVNVSHADGSVKTTLDNHETRIGNTEVAIDALTPDSVTNLGARLTTIDNKLEDIEVNLKDFILPDTTDHTQSFIDAEAYTVSLGTDARLLVPRGTYKITNKVMIRCALDADQATLEYYGTGTALVIGNDSVAGSVTARRRYHLPRVINMSRGTTGWDGTSVGVKCVNLNACEVFVPFIQDFENGLVIYGYSQGTAYSNFHLGAMWENHKNIVLDGDATGWVNQNVFIGGRLQMSLSKGATADDVNAKLIDMSSTIQPNNNTFIGTSIEGINVCYYRVDISGRHNVFYNCRWESQSSAIVRVRYRASAYANSIHCGYDASKIEETFDAGSAGGGEIRDSLGAYTAAFNTSGQLIPTGVSTTINSWTTPVGRRITYNAGTGDFTPRAGRWKITATACFAPNATGRRFLTLICNGSTRDIYEVPGNAVRASMKVEDVYKFDGTQTFKFQVHQTSGADLALETTSGYVKMQAEYLGY